ncbi:hypothetical protein HYH02_000955 [Chlamydomonas schloesseri]|uniref:Centrosomal protein POC5 n=1 Tax=Chlamydomonas schloesseri TaxID=2026947 RepID=A0A836BD81_9CHLO|nr:hypothetical protein HYH02_000955 [Chlamydomonas schloesseri]|eukprot:KAG2455136.1 hypothetical protein HYH02_000955 [Chlamydomonas schloesseri]
MSNNPYLAYDFLRRTEGPAPVHPLVSATTRTAAPAVLTTAPAAALAQQPEPVSQPTMSLSLGGGSSIDIVVPAAAPAPGPVPQQDASASITAATLAPAQPSYAFSTYSSTGGAAPAPPQPAVEITITSQQDPEPDVALVAASHLEGLTVQQMLDLDVDSLAVKIDKHHCATKKAVLDHFMETKARLMQAQNDAVEEERRRCAARLAVKDEEINLLKAELEAMKNKAARLWEILNKACTLYGQAKVDLSNTKQLSQLFYAWREQALILARRKRLAEKAEHWYTEVHLKRNVFRGWFRVAMREHRVTVNNRYIQEVEKAKRLIHEHYQGQIADLQRMLADAHAQLEREAEARNRLEDNMKRAFMRGVCALNIEAMNVMKRGAPPGGANPFPINLPPVEPAGGPAAPATAAAPVSAPLSETMNLDLRGSITLSPSRLPAGTAGFGAGAAPPSAVQAASVPAGPHPPTSITGAVRLAGNVILPAAMPGYAVGGGASVTSRPPSSSGTVGGAGGNPLVVKATGMPAPGIIPAANTAPSASVDAAAPSLRETAQAFYQRPQVVVTRGPGVGGGSGGAAGADAPRPRAGAPLPTVRMV